MPRGNVQNLKNLKDRSPEELKEITSKAGKASVAARRRKKSMREWAQILGQEMLTNSNGDKMSRDAIIILQQYNNAIKGDVRSAKFLAELLGEYNIKEANENQTNKITIEVVNNADKINEEIDKL